MKVCSGILSKLLSPFITFFPNLLKKKVRLGSGERNYHGVINPTTPMGCLRTWLLNLSIGRVTGAFCLASMASAWPAKYSKHVATSSYNMRTKARNSELMQRKEAKREYSNHQLTISNTASSNGFPESIVSSLTKWSFLSVTWNEKVRIRYVFDQRNKPILVSYEFNVSTQDTPQSWRSISKLTLEHIKLHQKWKKFQNGS